MLAQPPSLPIYEPLTTREREVLALIAAGQTTKQVAATLGLSFKTAACHRYHITAKLNARNVVEMVRNAAQVGLIEFAAPGSPSDPEEPLAERVDGVLQAYRRDRERLRQALDESAALRRCLRERRSQLTDAWQKNRKACERLLASAKVQRGQPLDTKL